MMFLDGFGVSNYRSFGSSNVLFCPLEKMNIIVGKNNSGKSNALRYLNTHFSNVLRNQKPTFGNLDIRRGLTEDEIRYYIAFRSDLSKVERLNSRVHNDRAYVIETLNKMTSGNEKEYLDGVLLYEYQFDKRERRNSRPFSNWGDCVKV